MAKGCPRCGSSETASTTEGRRVIIRCAECSLFLGNPLTAEAAEGVQLARERVALVKAGDDLIADEARRKRRREDQATASGQVNHG
jgi:uncharacterized Zn finger protein